MISVSTGSFGQSVYNADSTTCDYPSCAVVIAFSGLRLRESPGTASKTLLTIPFASKVALIPDPAATQNSAEENFLDADSIAGNWVKVNYQGKTGYVFNAYLGDGILKLDKPSYLIMEDAAGCWSDAYASREYHYYGLFLDKSRQNATLKAIKPVFHTTYDAYNGTSMHASGKERPFFMVVTREPLAEDGPIKRHHFFSKIGFEEAGEEAYQMISNDSILPAVRIPESNWEVSCINQKISDSNYTYEAKVLQLKDRATGKKQIIIDETYYLHEARIIWCGDLDRDGIQDFMLMGSSEHSGFCALFLSRKAGKGKLMRLAGIYSWEDCC